MEMHLTPLTLEPLPSASRPPPVLGPAMGQTAQECMEENPWRTALTVCHTAKSSSSCWRNGWCAFLPGKREGRKELSGRQQLFELLTDLLLNAVGLLLVGGILGG